MPSSYAKVLARVNGGAPQTGALQLAGGESVALTGENASYWQSALWQIYAYPRGWTAPAAGRSSMASTSPPPSRRRRSPSPSRRSSSASGSFRLIVDGGAGPGQLDASTNLETRSAHGVRAIAPFEDTEFDALQGWAQSHNDNAALLEGVIALGGGGGGGAGGPAGYLASSTFSLVGNGTTNNAGRLPRGRDGDGGRQAALPREGGGGLGGLLQRHGAHGHEHAPRLPPRGRVLLDCPSGVTIDGPMFVELRQQLFTARTPVTIKGAGEISPWWWGAVGDGTADDTVPIQRALDCANANGGGRVLLLRPPVAYKTTAALLIYSNTILAGVGKGFSPARSSSSTRRRATHGAEERHGHGVDDAPRPRPRSDDRSRHTPSTTPRSRPRRATSSRWSASAPSRSTCARCRTGRSPRSRSATSRSASAADSSSARATTTRLRPPRSRAARACISRAPRTPPASGVGASSAARTSGSGGRA